MIQAARENGYEYVGESDYAEYIFPDEVLIIPGRSGGSKAEDRSGEEAEGPEENAEAGDQNGEETKAAGQTEEAAANSGDKLAEIRERGTLLVGTTGDYRPMSYLDPETDFYWGFDIDLAQDLAEDLGVAIEYVPTTWPTLMDDTKAGSFDLAISGITITEDRQ